MSQDPDSPISPSERPAPAAARGTLVFVSHDTRDAELAEAFARLLTSVSAGMLKSFRSSDRKGGQGIDFGVEWYPELMSQLDSACDVVCLLTPRSLNRPWILFEAGVAKGKHDLPVHGLALGVPLGSASIGPFAQFQNCDDSVDSLAKLVEQIVRRLPNADPDHDTVLAQVEAFKAKVDDILSRADDGNPDEGPTSDGANAKLFEEIKVMFQDLPSRIDRVSGPRRPFDKRLDPRMMFEHAVMMTRGEPDVGFAALVATSAVRDELPWLYEMAVELYRAGLAGNRAAVRRHYEAFMRGMDSVAHGPLFHDIVGPGREDLRAFLDELPLFMRHLGRNLERPRDPLLQIDGEESGS